MIDRVALLIDILFDDSAREDERHDAAMDLGEFNDDRALKALFRIACDPNEDTVILDACGEAIAGILVQRNVFDKYIVFSLAPAAQKAATAYIKSHKPDWFCQK